MTVLTDAFSPNVFNTVSLTEAIMKAPATPSFMTRMNWFRETPILNTTAVIEWMNGKLAIVPSTLRGAPGSQVEKSTRKVITLSVPHYQVNDTILADDILNVRRFGSGDAESGQAEVVGRRLTEMRMFLETTLEYAMAGAVQGLVRYPTGSVNSNVSLFTAFGELSESTVELDLSATPATSILEQLMNLTDAS